MIIAGIDEAGYGPLLGPLVVSCAALEIPDDAPPDSPNSPAASHWERLPLDAEDLPDLWRLLKAAVARKPPATKGRILVADSKVVRNLSNGDRLLERGVLAFLHAGGCPPTSPAPGHNAPPPIAAADDLLRLLACPDHGLDEHTWYDLAGKLPHWCDQGDLAIASNMLRGALAQARLHVAAMRTRVVSESRFNRLVGGTQNKATALVSITLSHLHHLHTTFGARGLVVGVDKQGGRDHYTQLLLRTFPDAQLKVLYESDEASSYLLQEDGAPSSPVGRRTVIHFREKGESHFLPTALASMICKYLREICMDAFNTWWCARIAGLKPTAGYYQDGTRWLLDVEPHLQRLRIRREDLVRCR